MFNVKYKKVLCATRSITGLAEVIPAFFSYFALALNAIV